MTDATVPKVTRLVMAEILGLPGRSFDTLLSKGIFKASVRGAPGRPAMFDISETVRGYITHLRGSTVHPRDRRDSAQAAWLETKLKKEHRELLPADQVRREGVLFATALAAKLQHLPAQLVRAGAIPGSAVTTVTTLVNELRADCSRWRDESDLIRAIAEGSGSEPETNDTPAAPGRPQEAPSH